MVDTFLVTTEEWMKVSECDILHQTTEREREREREREFHNTAILLV